LITLILLAKNIRYEAPRYAVFCTLL
jgi:hypothetical protein